MKGFTKLLFTSLVIMLVFNFHGCKSRTETYESDKGTVNIDRKGDKADITIETKEGETFSMSVNKGELPEKWPSEIPVLPGGDIIFSQTEAQSNMQQISIETKKTIDEAMDFYKKSLESGGWSAENTMTMPQMKMVTAKKDGRDLMLQIARAEDKTHIQIIIK